MARALFLLIGLALIGLGVYWLWFEPSAASKAVVTQIETAVQMVRDGEGRIPLRVEAPPPFLRVHRTELIRPGYAACRVEDPPTEFEDEVALGCRHRFDASLQPGGWRIEQTAMDNLGQQVACLRVLLFPISGTKQRYWYATSPLQVSSERACRAPVRGKFPWALPNSRLRYEAIAPEDSGTLAEAKRAWELDGRSGFVTRLEDLAYNQFWRDESFEEFERLVELSAPPASTERPHRVLVAGRELGLPTPASLLLIDTPAGRMSVRLGGAQAIPPAPWQGVIDEPGILEGRFVAGMQDGQPLRASLELGSIDTLDADVEETAVFSMGLGALLLVVAGLLHAGVVLRRGAA